MDDLISRKALIKEYDRAHVGEPGMARKLMEDAPGVQRWIPVSERLPEKHGKFLVLVPSKIRGYGYFPLLLWYKPKRGFYDSTTDWGDVEVDDVTHWMPLPEEPKE